MLATIPHTSLTVFRLVFKRDEKRSFFALSDREDTIFIGLIAFSLLHCAENVK